MDGTMTTATSANDYRRRGWSPIRLKGKIPAEPWAEYQQRCMTLEEVEEKPWPGVGVVTGAISGIVVLDADSPEAVEELKRRGHPATPMVKTARGVHAYFRHPGGELPTRLGLGSGLDLKGDGGYVVTPPSKHPSGATYEWIIGPQDEDPAPLPAWVMEQIRAHGRRATAEDLGQEIPNGSRNATITSIAGTLRRRGLGETAIFAALLGINAEICHPPLPENEVQTIASSVARYRPDQEASESFYSSVTRDEVADERKTLLFKTARQVAEETPADVDWIARPWSAKGAITEIDGKVKAAGKTTFVSHMLAAIVDGKRFMGEPTTKAKVVWLTEQSPATFRKVLERANLTERDDVLVVHWHDAMGMEWEDVARAATAKAVDIGASLLVVDTLGQFAGIKGDGENNAGAAQEAMQPLQEAAAKGLAVAFTRHERKGGGEVGESGRGSSAFGGAVDVIMTLRRGEGNTRASVRVVEALSRFDETPDKVVVELTDQGYRNLGTASAFAEKEAQDAIVEILPAKAEHALATADVLDRLSKQGVKRTVGTDALARLTESSTIERLGEGKKGSPYRYYKPTPEDRPGDSESPDPLVQIHSSATPTYIRTNAKTLCDGASEERIRKLEREGMKPDRARKEVLGEGGEDP
jgi:Bifunctional DNA primase/polymerase, N-terminal/AAA domain/Primase C terminal 1 (PriCT-1)